MSDTSSAVSGSAPTIATAASILSSSTTNIDWCYKGWTFFFIVSNNGLWIYFFSWLQCWFRFPDHVGCQWSVRESSWRLFPVWFNCLFQRALVVCCYRILLERLSSDTLVILLGFKLGSSLGFTIIFVRIITWGSGRYISSPPNLGLTGSW